MNTGDHLARWIDPLARRLRTMIMRGTLSSVDDSQDLQVMQVSRLAGEVLDGCERLGQYGLASVPPAGSEVLLVQIGSNADHQVVAGVEDKSRPHPLTEGQTTLYDSAGTTIALDAAGNLNITCSGQLFISATTIVISATTTTFNGNVFITGLLNGHAP